MCLVDVSKLKCAVCGVDTQTEALLAIHQLTHPNMEAVEHLDSDNEPFWQLPPLTAEALDLLAKPRQTMIIHSETTTDTQKCQKCDKSFDNGKELAMHIKQHLQAEAAKTGKRGRGRPRKYVITPSVSENEATESKSKSPQKATSQKTPSDTVRSSTVVSKYPNDSDSDDVEIMMDDDADHDFVVSDGKVKLSDRVPNIPQNTIIRTRRQTVREKEVSKNEVPQTQEEILPVTKITITPKSMIKLEKTSSEEELKLPPRKRGRPRKTAIKMVDITPMKTESVVTSHKTDCAQFDDNEKAKMSTEHKTRGKMVSHLNGMMPADGRTSGGEIDVKLSSEAVAKDTVEMVENRADQEEMKPNIQVIEVVQNKGEEPKEGDVQVMEIDVSAESEYVLSGDTNEQGTEDQPESLDQLPTEDASDKASEGCGVADIEGNCVELSDNRVEDTEGDCDNQQQLKPIIKYTASPESKEKMKQCMKHCNIDVESNGKVSYTCKECKKVFPKLEALSSHLHLHLGTFKCQYCAKNYSNKGTLVNHVCKSAKKELNDDSGVFSCSQCGKNFDKLQYLQRHMMGHTNVFQCKDCHKKYARKESLLKHLCPVSRDIKKEPGEVEKEQFHYCEFCGQQFTNKKYLVRHMAAHTGEFKCDLCEREFSRKESLLMHMQRHHPGTVLEGTHIFPCKVCPRVFTKELSLQNHMMLHTEDHKCKKCHRCFASKFSLDRHEDECTEEIGKEENGVVVYKCNECEKSFTKPNYLQRHAAIHTAEFSCVICGNRYARKEELAKHMLECSATVQAETTGQIKCKVCGEVFADPPSYRIHYTEHTHPYKCDHCGQMFLRKTNLITHKCDPWDGEPVICEICKKKFRHPKYLQRHMVIHGEAKYKCNMCNKKFVRIDYYNDHTCISETGERVRVRRNANKDEFLPKEKLQYICPTCGRSYVSLSNLNKHMITHDDKKESCDICHKMFHLKVALREHMKSVHTDKYHHQCQYCGKFMKSRNSIFGHVRQFHSETLIMYQCEECGKNFRQKGNLKKHVLIHTDEKLFKCTLCERTFKYPEQLRRHELWHKDGNKFHCHFCHRRFVMQFELSKHMRIFHSGHVYTCEFCYTECRHAHTMKRHLQRRHMDEAKWQVNTLSYIKTLIRERVDGDTSKLVRIQPQPTRVVAAPAATVDNTTTLVGQLDTIQSKIPGAGEHPFIVAEVSGISSSGEAESTQTIIIQTGPNQFETSGTILPAELAEALQTALADKGGLDTEQNTMTIIGDITQSDGQTVPVALSGGGDDGQGYIIVPMMKLNEDAHGSMEVDEVDIVGQETVENVNIIEDALSQAMMTNSVNQDGFEEVPASEVAMEEVSYQDGSIMEVPITDGNLVPVSDGEMTTIQDANVNMVSIHNGSMVSIQDTDGNIVAVPVSESNIVAVSDGNMVSVPTSDSNIETDFVTADMVEIPVSDYEMVAEVDSMTHVTQVAMPEVSVAEQTAPEVTTVFST